MDTAPSTSTLSRSSKNLPSRLSLDSRRSLGSSRSDSRRARPTGEPKETAPPPAASRKSLDSQPDSWSARAGPEDIARGSAGPSGGPSSVGSGWHSDRRGLHSVDGGESLRSHGGEASEAGPRQEAGTNTHNGRQTPQPQSSQPSLQRVHPPFPSSLSLLLCAPWSTDHAPCHQSCALPPQPPH